MTLIYRFDDFEIDVQGFRLLKAGKVVGVEPKALNLLIFLVENRSRLLDRKKLIDAVWNDAFVTDHVLNRAVGQLRKLLEDDPKNPRYIETVHTLGYRFISVVESETTSESQGIGPIAANFERPRESGQKGDTPSQLQSSDSSDPVPRTAQEGQSADDISPGASSHLYWRFAALAGMALLVVAGAGISWRMRGVAHVSPAARIQSLAVLPLENLSGDASQEYMADGVTDELITGLGEVGSLKVISRTTAMQYKNPHKSLQQISKELGVDAVVEGSVQRSGDHVRIAVQLVDTSEDKQLWAKSYEGELRDILGMENQVSSAVTDQIRAKLTASEQARLATPRSVNPRAYEAVLKGHYVEKFTPESERKALQFFQQASQLDPNYARAYVGMARAYNFLAHMKEMPMAEAAAAADQNIARALVLDPQSAEAYDARGWNLLIFHWDFPGAERDFRRALELGPIATAHDGLATYLMIMGRFDEALTETRRAVEQDPLSPLILADACGQLTTMRNYDEALKDCKAALDLDPDFGVALNALDNLYALDGNHAEERKLDAKLGCDAACMAMLDEVDGVPGKKGAFDAWMKSLGPHPANPMVLAYCMERLGRKDEAFAWLEKAYEERENFDWMIILGVDPSFYPLHSDPRFDAFLRRVGLPPAVNARTAAHR